MINLKEIFGKLTNVEQDDIVQDDEKGQTIVKLDDKAFEFVLKNIDSSNDKWIKQIRKQKNKISVSTEWKTIFERK